MTTAARKDPLPAFCFKVTIAINGEQTINSFFKSVGGVKQETEVVDYKSGGVNNATYKLLGAAKWSNLVLKRGFTDSVDLMDWRNAWVKPGGDKKRATVTVQQLNTQLQEVAGLRWEFVDCWPCKWELSEFDAAKNEIVIETLELAHHGIKIG